VVLAPEAHAKLKRLTRRRRVLVNEKVRVVNRLHADLQAICPGLAQITGAVDNLWFLRFLTARKTLPGLARMRKRSLLAIRGVGNQYAAIIQTWQPTASFSTEVEDVGPMIQEDVHRILALLDQIAALETKIETVATDSELVRRIRSIPGLKIRAGCSGVRYCIIVQTHEAPREGNRASGVADAGLGDPAGSRVQPAPTRTFVVLLCALRALS